MTGKSTCEEALSKLKAGNKRFREGQGKWARRSPAKKEKAPAQHPYAVILGCSDSRVIPERIFDANPGELFVVRVAGNIASSDVIASVEYAVKYLKVPLVLTLGHEACGAVESTINFARNRLDLGQHLNALVAEIIPVINPPDKRCDHLPTAIRRNALHTSKCLLERSPILSEYHKNDQLLICSGYFHLTGKKKGKVSMLKKCSCP